MTPRVINFEDANADKVSDYKPILGPFGPGVEPLPAMQINTVDTANVVQTDETPWVPTAFRNPFNDTPAIPKTTDAWNDDERAKITCRCHEPVTGINTANAVILHYNHDAGDKYRYADLNYFNNSIDWSTYTNGAYDFKPEPLLKQAMPWIF